MKRPAVIASTRLLLCLLLCMAWPAFAFPEGDITKVRTLPNGLRVIVREQHRMPIVAVDVWVRAGSGLEGPNEGGAAHFLEHLLFKGTATRRPGEIDAVFEDMGATLNAGTTRDAAHFYTTVPSPYLSTALETLADLVSHPALDPTEVERERAIILDEMARSRNDARKQALDALYAKLCGGHPYARPILGDPISIRRLSRESITAFFRSHYRPGNTTVVLVGDVGLEQAMKDAASAFGAWSSHGDEKAVAQGSTQIRTEGSVEATSGVPLRVSNTTAPGPDIVLGVRVNAGTEEKAACTADVLLSLLADTRTGRLASTLVETGLVHDVYADYATLRDPGVTAIGASALPGKRKAVRQALGQALDRLIEADVSADELEFAKRRVLGAYLFDTEKPAGQARLLGYHDMVGNYNFAIEYPDLVRKVTVGDIREFAKRYFMPSQRVEIDAGSE